MKKLITLLAVLFVLSPVMASINIATVINPFTLHRKVVEVGDPNAFNSGYILETRPMYDMLFNSEPLIGAKPFRPSGYETTLSSQLAEEGSETTLIVNSLTLPDDTTLDDANYGDLLILTVGEGDSEEKIAVTTLNETTLTFTIYSRGLEYGRWASSTDNMVQHLPGERVYVSNDDHFLYEQYYSLDGDETTTGDTSFAGDLTFTGANDFTGGTITVPAPSADADASTKKYVDDTILAGAPDGTESVKGVNELATQSEMSLGTLQGSTATNLVLQSQYATSTPNVDGLYLPVSESDGYLNQGWLDLTEDYSWSGTNINSGTNTFNATTTFNDTLLGAYDFLFGSGSDSASTTAGDVVFSEDMYFTDYTISEGDTVYPNGYKLFVRGTLTISSTTSSINGDGGDGISGAVGTGAGGAGGAGVATTTGTLSNVRGNAGSAGNTGATGIAGLPGVSVYNSTGSAGSAGGAGGRAFVYNGIAGPAGSELSEANSALYSITDAIPMWNFALENAGVVMPGAGGGSGGGGCGSGSYAGGGGGGGGASGIPILIVAKNIIKNGDISSNGGDGGDGGDGEQSCGSSSTGGGGGGGGGVGGLIVLVYQTLTGSGSLTVTGGTAGTGGADCDGSDGENTGGPGAAGANGGNGVIRYLGINK